MIIKELKLKNFRNYHELILNPDAGVNLFYGPNGSGKTNILEAVHYCSLGRSHRITNDALVVQKNQSFGSASVLVQNQLGNREITVKLLPDDKKKKSVLLDQKKAQKFSDMMGCLRCVIFSPEDLELIKEGPSLRRRYLDMMISQISRPYFVALQQYKAGLEQRNAILKAIRSGMTTASTLLDSFEAALIGPAVMIIRERKKIVQSLSAVAEQTYRKISGTEEIFHVDYHTEMKEEEQIEETLLRQYRENRENEIRIGMTVTGPHRDDLILTLNQNLMKQYASQGQIRTAALSLKLSQLQILHTISGEAPVLLLDDVMSELDRERRKRLIGEIHSYQTFITCTDREEVEHQIIQKYYHVSSMESVARIEEEAPVSRGTEEEERQ